MEKNKKMEEAFASILKRGDKEALAALLVEYVQPNHITANFVGMLLNTRTLKPGDSLVKKMRKGIEVRTLVPGSIHLASEITVRERINYILDGADVKVSYDEWDLENGNIGTVQDISTEMMAKLRDYYQNKVFTALTTVWTAGNTPSNYTAVGGNLNETVLKAAIDNINQTVGKVRAVVGVRAALTPITTFGAFWKDTGGSLYHGVDSQLEKVMKEGWLGTYYGAEIIALNQEWDNPEDYNTLIPTDKVLVIGENVGDFIIYGEPKWKQWTDMAPTPPRFFMEVYQQFGLMIDKAMGIHVLGTIS
jgi:hypothetical protein